MTFFQRIATFGIVCWVALVFNGCSNGVREDRTMNYSSEGGNVAFQHGDDGLFVASSDGAKLDKIFDSTGVLASSSPLWSPIDKRLIFTTIQPRVEASEQEHEDPQPLVQGAWDANPDGRLFLPGQVEYTCWLREETTDEDTPSAPIPLFTARCNHSGYVAANLAARWHPGGQKIVFLDSLDDGLLGLYEFDLSTRKKRALFEYTGVAMVFDWSPKGNFLSCTLVASTAGSQHDGTWVFAGNDLEPEAEKWWHVPGSQHFSIGQSYDLLEVLRGARPVWSSDERAFAFIARRDAGAEQGESKISVAKLGTRQVDTWYVAKQPLRDVHWHPTGKALGFVEGVTEGQLRIVRAAVGDGTEQTSELVSEVVSMHAIRRFAGWSARGDQMSFVSPIPDAELQHRWALLFPLVPAARDRVYTADEEGGDTKLVHEGMRISFPKWSTTDNKLSLWGTFTPSHRCWSAVFLPGSLRPGDPAAILDGATGELSWLAVNAREKSQVGHLYMLKQQYERAWEWYEQGAVGREPARPLAMSALGARDLIAREPWFFEYYCLKKLGRFAEADARLNDFRKAMEIDVESLEAILPQADATQPETQLELRRLVDFIAPLLQAVHAAEVFLSLNAASDGVEYFQRQWDQATSEYERFAFGLCLTQMHLASGGHAAYADFVTDELMPLVEQLLRDRTIPKLNDLPTEANWQQWRNWLETTGVAVAAGTSLLPMGSEEFMATLTEDHVRALLPKWQLLVSDSSLPCTVVVLAMLGRLGEEASSDLVQTEQRAFLLDELRVRTPQDVSQLILQLTDYSRAVAEAGSF